MPIAAQTRRIALLATFIVAAVVACASPGMPPGGPPDAEVPVVLRVLPDSNAVNVRAPAVVLQFDEVVNERSTPVAAPGAGGTMGGGTMGSSGGAGSLASLLVISPSDGRDEVLWRRTQLELRPRRGFRPNTAYRVTLQPGLADLRGNRVTEPFSFVFTTGTSLPDGEISGVLFDWTAGAPARNARVDVFLDADTTFRWSTRTDSTGRFRLRELAPASYEVRAWLDLNNDQRISFREISDSARVTLSDTATLELYAYGRDTLPPRLETIELVDSTALRIKLDRGIVANWDGLGAALFDADSTVIPLGGPFIPSVTYDSLAKLRRAAADSATADSLRADSAQVAAAPGDSAVRGGELAVPAARPPDTVRVENTRPPVLDTAAAPSDSVAADSGPPLPIFKRQVPVQQWTVPLAGPLAPGSYRFRLAGPEGLNGRRVEVDREFRVQPPPPKPAAPDSSGRNP